MQRISTFTVKGTDVDILYRNGQLAYSFIHNGKPYGVKVAPKSRKTADIADAVFLLLTNFLDTKEQLDHDSKGN